MNIIYMIFYYHEDNDDYADDNDDYDDYANVAYEGGCVADDTDDDDDYAIVAYEGGCVADDTEDDDDYAIVAYAGGCVADDTDDHDDVDYDNADVERLGVRGGLEADGDPDRVLGGEHRRLLRLGLHK